ncbi:histidine kinase [Cohnella sp. CFH 77786]|uniref:sensor histidine kinase n=1 Tax=Cohnella sp. CFH 77786 TaxID=2662265 RepID=UPI001C60B795|nr:histidine kinase [Cohnella sp. CFH 77786]
MNFLKRHVRVLRTFSIILTLLFAAGGALAAFERDADAVRLDSSAWQWAPAQSWNERSPPTDGWRPYTAPVEVAQTYYWLRVPLPPSEWKDPSLFMLHMGGNRVVADGRIVYENDPANLGVRVNSGFYWHMARLPLPVPGHVDLLLRNGVLSKQNPSIEFGEKASFVNRSLHKDLDNVILGALLIFSSLVSLGLYASHRDKLYLYFALLAFAGGYASLVGNQFIKFLWSDPRVSSLQETAMPWATFAVVGALEQVFPDINRRIVKTLRRIVLGFSVMATAGALNVYFYTFWTSYLYLPVFMSMFVISYWTIWKAYRNRRDVESIWVMAGFTSLVAVAFVHVVRYWLPPGLYEWWPGLQTYLDNLPEDLIYLGLFAFVICLIRVIVYRYTAMNRQLTEVNRSLEQLVESRIEEIQASNRQLEIANERLAASLKESAEAMAETIMLEERHRITGAIHDTVGHTLSAAIIQLEAARKLLPLDRAQAEEKLEASQFLARQGLEDIRQSVRLLREDSGHFDLPGAIGALIRETEQTSGCSVECRIGPLPDSLSFLQKRVLFQALQEGLASGVKRGAARCFDFELTASSGAIRFLLIRDGIALPEEAAELGMKSVTERISRLGGELRLQHSQAGAVLFVSMPA